MSSTSIGSATLRWLALALSALNPAELPSQKGLLPIPERDLTGRSSAKLTYETDLLRRLLELPVC